MNSASKSAVLSFLAASTLLTASTAAAEGFYISGSLGAANQESSSNSGSFTSAFTTGTVTGVEPPLNIAAGSGLSWNTVFDSDINFSGAIGYDYGNLRAELSVSHHENNVNRHTGVTAAGIDLSNIDAGVLISGNVGDLGVSTAGLVGTGAGEIENTSVMLNGYYDFDFEGDLTPYIGFGIGNVNTDVSFAPSATPIVNDDDTGFAWQFIVGADYMISDSLSFFGNYRYVSADEATVNVSLVPATLEIDNDFQIFELGLKFSL